MDQIPGAGQASEEETHKFNSAGVRSPRAAQELLQVPLVGVPSPDEQDTAVLTAARAPRQPSPESLGETPTIADAVSPDEQVTAVLPSRRRADATQEVSPDLSGQSNGGLRAALALPWPRWLGGAAAGGSLAAVALAFLVAVNVLRADWAIGALAGGVAALIIAALAAFLWTVRFVLGQQTYSALAFTLLLVFVLAGIGVAGIQETIPIHALEAAHLEQAHRYQSAIQEYELTGQSAPGSKAIARTLTEWGEQLLAEHQYDEASVRFNTVITLYPQGGSTVARATTDLFQTLRAWLGAGAQDMPFSDAITILDNYRATSACDSACQQETDTLEAHARFLYGEQLLTANDYLDAAEQFVTVQKKFSTSAYASLARSNAATAYFAYGKAQVSTPSCANAVPIYKNLAQNYADTPEGRSATRALAAPGSVRGVLTGFPKGDPPTLYLSRQADPANFYYSDNYRATVDPKTGAFTFSGVQQNAYFLSAVLSNGGAAVYTLYHDKSSGQPYVVVVGPLCSTNIGTVPYT